MVKYLQHARAIVARPITWLFGLLGPISLPGPGGHPFIIDVRRGRVLAVMGGADGEGDGDGSGDGADGSGDGDGDGSGDGADGEGDGEGAGSGDGGEGDGEGDAGKVVDWKAQSRKHERQAKKERKDREALAARLKEFEDRDKSEQEKAIEQARQEGETAAESKYAEQRRADRIETAVTKLALKGFKVGDGDDAKTLRFADPDDAQLRLERALRAGDLSYDDIYNDGKAETAALTEFLSDVLQDNEHLQARTGNGNGSGRHVGDGDAGKGKGSAVKKLEDMSPDDHLKEIQGR